MVPEAKGKSPKLALANQKLIRENAQLKKRLAHAEAILELQKKVSALLGDHIHPVENSEMS